MKLLRLKANPEHPTYKKVERLIGLLENIKLELEWVDGVIKIRDTEYCVAFDFVTDDDRPQTDMPPTFEYKLTREKAPNRYCKCRHCDPNYQALDK
jgi:hypothetical protein